MILLVNNNLCLRWGLFYFIISLSVWGRPTILSQNSNKGDIRSQEIKLYIIPNRKGQLRSYWPKQNILRESILYGAVLIDARQIHVGNDQLQMGELVKIYEITRILPASYRFNNFLPMLLHYVENCDTISISCIRECHCQRADFAVEIFFAMRKAGESGGAS